MSEVPPEDVASAGSSMGAGRRAGSRQYTRRLSDGPLRGMPRGFGSLTRNEKDYVRNLPRGQREEMTRTFNEQRRADRRRAQAQSRGYKGAFSEKQATTETTAEAQPAAETQPEETPEDREQWAQAAEAAVYVSATFVVSKDEVTRRVPMLFVSRVNVAAAIRGGDTEAEEDAVLLGAQNWGLSWASEVIRGSIRYV